jgi:hypothetical protein
LLLFSGYRLNKYYLQEKQHEFIVYAVNGHSAYDVIEGKEHVLMTDQALMSREGGLDYSIKPHWLEMGLNNASIIILDTLDKGNNVHGKLQYIPVSGLRIVAWQGSLPACHPPDDPLALDCLILRGSGPYPVQSLNKWFGPKIFIIDTSVPPWEVKTLKEEAFNSNIWIVKERGAFLWNY